MIKKAVKRLALTGMQLIKKCKSIVNGLLKQYKQLSKTLCKLHLTKIHKKRLFDHHPVTSKYDIKTYKMLFVNNYFLT